MFMLIYFFLIGQKLFYNIISVSAIQQHESIITVPFYLFHVFLLASSQGMWNLGFLTNDKTHAPCIGSVES